MIYSTALMNQGLRYNVIHPMKKDYLNDGGRYSHLLDQQERKVLTKVLEHRIDFDFEVTDYEVYVLEKALYHFWGKHPNLLKVAKDKMSEWKNREKTKNILPELGT